MVMALIDPSPYLVIYGVLVFLAPWLIYGGYIVSLIIRSRLAMKKLETAKRWS